MKLADGIYKNMSWLIISLSLIAYFFYHTLKLDGDIQTVLTDIHSWIHMIFVIYLNVMIAGSSNDKGVQIGLESQEFILADGINNELIRKANNQMGEFRGYVKQLNEHERIILQEDFLFKVGDKKLEELTKKERKQYDKLKPIHHNIYGFNLPLYYEMDKNGSVKYDASYERGTYRKKAMFKKIFTGFIFGVLTVNMIFEFDKIGDALVSLLIIGSGLVSTWIIYLLKPIFILKYEKPKIVIQKDTLWGSFEDFKSGKKILKSLTTETE